MTHKMLYDTQNAVCTRPSSIRLPMLDMNEAANAILDEALQNAAPNVEQGCPLNHWTLLLCQH